MKTIFVSLFFILAFSSFSHASILLDTTRAATGDQSYNYSPSSVEVRFAMNAGNPAIMVEFDHLGTQRTLVFHSSSVTQMGMSISDLEQKIIHAVNTDGIHLQIAVMEVGRTVRANNIIEVSRFALKTNVSKNANNSCNED